MEGRERVSVDDLKKAVKYSYYDFGLHQLSRILENLQINVFIYYIMQVELVILPRSIVNENPPDQQNQQPPPPPPQNEDSGEEQNEEEDQEVC